MNSLPFFVLAAVLVAMACWGGRRAGVAVATGDESQREHRCRVIRRGARSCWVLAGVFAVFGIATLVSSAGG